MSSPLCTCSGACTVSVAVCWATACADTVVTGIKLTTPMNHAKARTSEILRSKPVNIILICQGLQQSSCRCVDVLYLNQFLLIELAVALWRGRGWWEGFVCGENTKD